MGFDDPGDRHVPATRDKAVAASRTTLRTKPSLAAGLAPAATLLVVFASAAPVAAATATASLNVSATVIASCTIAAWLIANPQAALAAPAAMCAGPASGVIVARRPAISVEHDASIGVTRLVFAF